MGSRDIDQTIPLGPFAGQRLRLFSGKSKTSRLHSTEQCRSLRSGTAQEQVLPLSEEVMARRCDACSPYSMGPLGSSLRLFFHAVLGPGLERGLERYTIAYLEDDLEYDHDGSAALLRDEHELDEDDEEQWQAYRNATEYRSRLRDFWVGAFESLSDCAGTIGRYPWLEDWARDRMDRKAGSFLELGRRLSAFVSTEWLLTGAAVPIEAPAEAVEALAEDRRMSALGDHSARLRIASQCWSAWSESAREDWGSRSGYCYEAHRVISDHFGRRWKGRDDVTAAVDEAVSAWNEQARAAVTVTATDPDKECAEEWVAVQFPSPPDRDDPWTPGTHRLSDWEVALLATYGKAHDWRRRIVLLRVPGLVARRLIEGHRELSPTMVGNGAPSPRQNADEVLQQVVAADDRPLPVGPLPGVLDDGPLRDRRSLTAADVAALREIYDDHEVFVVMSVLGGVESIRLGELAERCASGWTGVVVFQLTAPPGPLTASYLEPEPEDQGSAHGRSDYFALPLDADEAGKRFADAVRNDGLTNSDPAADLAAYAAGRTVPDLRTLGRVLERGNEKSPVRWRVWMALLADERLDLEPFQVRHRLKTIDLVLPIGILNTVQVYTSRYGGQKHHSMYCRHSREGEYALESDATLLTFAELLEVDDDDWCARCGGYAVRRMSANQFRYYEAARELYACAEDLAALVARKESSSPKTLEQCRGIIEDLEGLDSDEVLTWDLWEGQSRWTWIEVRRKLMDRARALESSLAGTE